MTKLQQSFTYDGAQIRTYEEDSMVWFVLKDVCNILEIANSRNVYNRLDEDEKGVHSIDTPGGNQEMQVINEPGLYATILRAKSDKAKPFRRWVTHDVLPSIRKRGYYSALAPSETIAAIVNDVEDPERRKVLIDGIRLAGISQDDFVAEYMGIDAQSVPQKIVSISEYNNRAKWLMRSWRRNGVYTINDLHPPKDIPEFILRSGIERARRGKNTARHFTRYCGETYFNNYGVIDVIVSLERMGMVQSDVAEVWRAGLNFED